jgi:methylase of polypeptide subunit release factors
MKGERAYKIIQHNHLVLGKSSRIILNKIMNDEAFKEEELPENISQAQINQLKSMYQAKLAELKENKNQPRYLPFYHLIKDKYPSFVWNTEDTQHHLHAPRISNLRPSLLSLLLGLVSEERDTLLHRKYACVNRLPHAIAYRFDQFMKESNSFYPPENEMNEIVKLIELGLQKNKITIFIPVCPDYAYKYTNNPQCPVEFTFTELGCGNGIIAQWILSVLEKLAVFFSDCQIDAEFVIAMADFEAFAEENLKTFGISKAEFLRRTFLSKEAFKKACPIPAKVILFTELCNEEKWLQHIEAVKTMFMQRDFGASEIDRNILLSIVANRKALYSKWYGERESLEEYIQIALNQGMMYAAMGRVINEYFEHCLVFAADNKVMRYFYSVTKKIPTLYLKKTYS